MGDTPRKYLSKDANKNAIGKRITFQEDKIKYSKIQFAQIYKGYDLLENLFTVRTYIQKHYDIDWKTLEFFIKLMGMRLFTRKDYSEIPRDFEFKKFRTFLDRGYIVVVSDDVDVEKRLFTLSAKCKNIVTNFYAYLSGEKKIPEDSVNNPLFNSKKMLPFDKKEKGIDYKNESTPCSRTFQKTVFIIPLLVRCFFLRNLALKNLRLRVVHVCLSAHGILLAHQLVCNLLLCL
ncbi:hypothetical protein RHP51_05010 [Thalassobellus suaedae]|uniref:Uncharacterized protein n=1 Tax=Thalassobellus suaedae TaxID=3074124 RepID=A0ABY9XVS5_9FLAO|nr:hypothetical protein RHP51_05010 [Flavobacteriaceae bacterium HL-DH14]